LHPIIAGTQIRKLINNEPFDDQLNEVERAVWHPSKTVTRNVLANHKAENYCEIMSDLYNSYKTMGYNMSLTRHLLDSHLYFSLKTLEQPLASTRNAFTNTFATWKSGTRVSGAKVW
jgi:hypothetical protein